MKLKLDSILVSLLAALLYSSTSFDHRVKYEFRIPGHRTVSGPSALGLRGGSKDSCGPLCATRENSITLRGYWIFTKMKWNQLNFHEANQLLFLLRPLYYMLGNWLSVLYLRVAAYIRWRQATLSCIGRYGTGISKLRNQTFINKFPSQVLMRITGVPSVICANKKW